VCLAGTALLDAGQENVAAYYGKRIASILFEPSRQPLTRDQLGLSLQIRPGDVLDEINLSRAMERLWATGRYEDIVVEAETVAEGVALTFRTSPAYFISSVRVEGVPEPPNPAQLSNSTKLNLGDPFDEALLPDAEKNLYDLLRANGFFSAKIRYESVNEPNTEEVNIRFIVEPGTRARFTRPVFEGTVALKENKLIRLTGWQRWFGLRGWQEVTASRVQKGLEKVQGAYLKSGYLMASVRLNPLEADAASTVVQPVFAIKPGPLVRVQTTGAKVSERQLRRLLPIYQERTVDRELLVEGQHALTSKFRNEGYFDAKVSYTITDPTPNGEQTITYQIERGPRYKLVHIDMTGNQYFDAKTIRERLNIIAARFPRFPRGRFSQDLLESDEAGIAGLYRANGFRDVKVTNRVERAWMGKPKEVAAFIDIDEGPQWFVADVELTGVDLRLIEEIRQMLTSVQGQPYSIASVAADRDAVLNWYFNNGYPDATFEANVTPAEQPQRVNLKYAVIEGRRNFVRDVLISGLNTTRPSLVNRRILVAPGEPLSQSAIVESQRRLYDLGIFAKVDVATQNPDGRERSKYVQMQVEEAKKYSLNLGFGAEVGRIGAANDFNSPAGYAGFSPRGLIGITRSNIFGLAHTASATARVSNIQQRLVLSYVAPQIHGNEKVNLIFSSLLDSSKNLRTYSSQRWESSVQAGQKVSRTLDMQYRVTSRFVFIDQDTLKIDPDLIPIYSQPVKTIAVSSSVVQDRRDDPILSHSGYYNSFDLGFAPRFSQSSTNYTRLVARNSTYYPVNREVTFARTTAFGWLYNLSEEPVPLPENFYSGGVSTHRGFPDNQAGPRDLVTGFPIGGQSFLMFQHELRFPLLGNLIGGAVFHDMGNVYSTLGNLSFRYHQKNDQDFDYMVQAVGVGVRVNTPVGPLRFEVAFAPNSPRFVGFVGTREELLSGVGGQYNVPQRVNRFQFHFSIGQAF